MPHLYSVARVGGGICSNMIKSKQRVQSGSGREQTSNLYHRYSWLGRPTANTTRRLHIENSLARCWITYSAGREIVTPTADRILFTICTERKKDEPES